jgi:2-hydroxyacyl-CoA lyase 1
LKLIGQIFIISGLVDDTNPRSVAPARSKALLEADVVLLLGSRLNWILHFGRPPRFNPNVKFIQVSLAIVNTVKTA